MHLYSNSQKLKQFRAVCPVREELKTGVYKKLRWASRLCLTQQHSMSKLLCFVTESKNKSVKFREKKEKYFFQHKGKNKYAEISCHNPKTNTCHRSQDIRKTYPFL